MLGQRHGRWLRFELAMCYFLLLFGGCYALCLQMRFPVGTRRCCDAESTSQQRRVPSGFPVGSQGAISHCGDTNRHLLRRPSVHPSVGNPQGNSPPMSIVMTSSSGLRYSSCPCALTMNCVLSCECVFAARRGRCVCYFIVVQRQAELCITA